MASLRVLNEHYILPSSQHYPPPGETVPLSFFDTFSAILPRPVRRFFLYPESDGGLSFPFLLQTLKSSLSKALLLFHPLAGKLTTHPTSGDAIIDCSPAAVGEGVAFIEAESDADIRRLASDEIHDVEAFLQLVPELDVRALPAPVLAVQVTRFTGGGVAIGFAVNHVVVDGRAFWRFMEAWSHACKTQACKRGGPLVIHPPPPSHDRSVIRLPNSDRLAALYWKMQDPAYLQSPRRPERLIPVVGPDMNGQWVQTPATHSIAAHYINKEHLVPITNMASRRGGRKEGVASACYARKAAT